MIDIIWPTVNNVVWYFNEYYFEDFRVLSMYLFNEFESNIMDRNDVTVYKELCVDTEVPFKEFRSILSYFYMFELNFYQDVRFGRSRLN